MGQDVRMASLIRHIPLATSHYAPSNGVALAIAICRGNNGGSFIL
jgi:hypothetical protein